MKQSNQLTKKVYVTIDSDSIPMGATHDLMCWICNEEPAVYDMSPNWIMRPCWSCQKKGIGDGKVFRHPLLKFISKSLSIL